MQYVFVQDVLEGPGGLASMRQAEQTGEAVHVALPPQQEKAVQHGSSFLKVTHLSELNLCCDKPA